MKYIKILRCLKANVGTWLGGLIAIITSLPSRRTQDQVPTLMFSFSYNLFLVLLMLLLFFFTLFSIS